MGLRWHNRFLSAAARETLQWLLRMFTPARWYLVASWGNSAVCLAMAPAHLFCAMIAELKNPLATFWEDFSLDAPINTRTQFAWPALRMVGWRCDSTERLCRGRR